jgi:ElaB/YqjD/DUF883 family membrane-anchored ribosome-binding protein
MMNTPNGLTTDDLRDQIATLRADFAKLSDIAAESAKDGFGAAGRKVAKTGREAREGVVDAVTSNPLTAIGIAAGVGYLLGVLTRR